MRQPTLIGGAAVLLTAAAGYLLLINPQSGATSTLRADLETIRTGNESASAQIPALKAQLEDISGDVEALRTLSGQVPPAIDLPALYAELDAVAAEAGPGVTVTNVSVTVPQLLTADPAAAATDPNAPVDPATVDPNAPADPGTAVDPNAPVDPGTAVDPNAAAPPAAVLASYDVTITVQATPEQAAAFIKALGATRRLSIVSTSGVTRDSDGNGTLNLTATFYLQQVDVDGLAAQIEALTAGGTVIAPGAGLDPTEVAPEPTEGAASGN